MKACPNCDKTLSGWGFKKELICQSCGAKLTAIDFYHSAAASFMAYLVLQVLLLSLVAWAGLHDLGIISNLLALGIVLLLIHPRISRYRSETMPYNK